MKKRKPVLRDQRYGRLLVLESQPAKTSGAKVACRCDCGKLVEVRVSHLADGFTKSCGCLNMELRRTRPANLVPAQAARNSMDIDGTNILHLQRNGKAYRNSTSGILGVSPLKGERWRAYITIKGKRIRLGNFHTIDEAAKARKEAEEKYYKPIIEEWERRQKE